MQLSDVLSRLESLGSEPVLRQNRKRGVGDNQVGVRLGDLRVLAKEIKPDRPLADALWQTGNLDARLLAILLTKAKLLSVADLDRMQWEIQAVPVADWFNAYLVKKHPHKEPLREPWMNSDQPMKARGGWSLTAERVQKNPAGLDLSALFDRIEAEMPTAHPDVQWTQNTTLAQIGIHSPAHRARALAIGESLVIYLDYPVPKGCTSPFAPLWINELVRRQGG